MIPIGAGAVELLHPNPEPAAHPTGREDILELSAPVASMYFRSLSRCPHCDAPNIRLRPLVLVQLYGDPCF